MSREKSFEWIKKGYQAFREEYYPNTKEIYRNLAEYGQDPDVLIIACSDSRANPTAIFKALPGDVFVVRNVANIVPPFAPDMKKHGTGAAIEYAVKVLKVKTIIVMGHAGCGGIAAHIDGTGNVKDDKFVGPWIRCLHDIHIPGDVSGKDVYEVTEKANVMQSIKNLKGYDFVASAIAQGQLEVIGSYFDIKSGTLQIGNDEGQFSPLLLP